MTVQDKTGLLLLPLGTDFSQSASADTKTVNLGAFYKKFITLRH